MFIFGVDEAFRLLKILFWKEHVFSLNMRPCCVNQSFWFEQGGCDFPCLNERNTKPYPACTWGFRFIMWSFLLYRHRCHIHRQLSADTGTEPGRQVRCRRRTKMLFRRQTGSEKNLVSSSGGKRIRREDHRRSTDVHTLVKTKALLVVSLSTTLNRLTLNLHIFIYSLTFVKGPSLCTLHLLLWYIIYFYVF